MKIDDKPVPVFFQSSNPDERCAKASIRGDAGQTFTVGFYDGRKRRSGFGREYELFFGDQRCVHMTLFQNSKTSLTFPAQRRLELALREEH